ncbi:zinc finger protein SNAI3 [Eublepharis macularius]|uniref:Zinc finger protein SNAI3 n=1 Tax=Eublepharis macularius TaxID=481883 RepID=A0AA97LIG5_EUBMA|nr:zinc finger protein SNAI3 [Eublepharis macularius]
MPRSFLVKKAASTRAPNYGQLETRRPESNGSCPTWQGLAFPLLMPDGAALSPCDSGRLWDRNCSSVVACLSLPLPQSSEAKGDPCGSSPPAVAGGDTTPLGGRLSGPPLRDNLDNLSLPSAFGLPSKRTLIRGSPAEGEGEKLLGEPSGAADPPERFECPDCRKSFHAFSGLARHKQQQCCKLQSAARKYFNCKYCDKEYASLGALKMHIRTHTLPCVCRICSKAFSRPWLLQGHIRTHTGEKPYACSHCSRAFADRSNLRAHLQTHSDIKKYQCHACSKTFSRMSLLLRHEEAGGCPAT